jgi:hypothetical protein
MPITYGSYTKQVKLLPLTLNSDGSAVVAVRWGFQSDQNDWTPVSEQQFYITPEEVSSILDSEPRLGMTRRDDLSLSVYEYLVQSSKIGPGEIS